MLSLQIHKRKQGQIVRWSSFGIMGLLFLYGGYRLYFFLSQWQWAIKHKWLRFNIPLVDLSVVIDPRFVCALACVIITLWALYYLCFQNIRVSEFLIETESEMRKVSWPSFLQVVKSSLAVILIVILLGMYLYFIDGVLNKFFSFIF